LSDKPVAERLQVKGDRRLAVIGASAALDKTVGASKARADVRKADVVLMFTPDRARLDAELPGLLARIAQSAILWVAYPKMSSSLAADLNRDVIHSLAPTWPRHGQPDRDRRRLVRASPGARVDRAMDGQATLRFCS
jgi:hypothetical protein